jgi:hypothetical protein
MILPLPPELSQLLTPFNYFLMLVAAILIPTIVTLDMLFSKGAQPQLVTVEVPTIQRQSPAAAPVFPPSMTDRPAISSKTTRKKQQHLALPQNNEKTIDQVLGDSA